MADNSTRSREADEALRCSDLRSMVASLLDNIKLMVQSLQEQLHHITISPDEMKMIAEMALDLASTIQDEAKDL